MSATAPARADDVALFLERHGLTELLAAHWEEQVEGVTGAAREELIERLAGVYAELLETTTDAARREELEIRSRRLIQRAPGSGTGALRLALLRASYRSAEAIAERHRLRLADEDELAQARETLSEIVPELARLRNQLEDQRDNAQRRLSRAAGTEAIVQAEAVDRAQQILSQCTFVHAWALYYQAWLLDRDEAARLAQRLFADLLEFGSEPVRPQSVSIDLRAVEPIARCILGMALARSRTGSVGIAQEWLVLLRHEKTFPALREQVPAWELVILLEHGEYLEARDVLARQTATTEEIPVAWLRLAAVGGLEGIERSGSAADLARQAVTALAARGELDQVLDLADRFGTDALGTSGFAMRYVEGALRYVNTRERHGDENPTADPDLRAAYAEAEQSLRTALTESDADKYPTVAPDCRRLIGWCAYFQGNLREARTAFEKAADELPPESASESLWMAILCLDRLVKARQKTPDLDRDLAALIERFLARYPSSPHAPKLVLRRAMAAETMSDERVEELLAIPAGSASRPAAQRLAEQALYRRFRDAEPVQRPARGARYLDVALLMQRTAEESVDPEDPTSITRLLTLSRRILEVALHQGVQRPAAAVVVMTSLEKLAGDGIIDLAPYASELAYRRAQLYLIRYDAMSAQRIADELWEADAEGKWARLASLAVFRDAVRQWRADPAVAPEVLQRIVDCGWRVIAKEAAESLDDPQVLARAATVAEATAALWRAGGDDTVGRRALVLYERLLDAHPRNARFLRATGLLSESLGAPEQALTCWRRLVAGGDPAQPAWYEAKFHLIDLLADADLDRARKVMEQHVQLNPDYGPDPWGGRLKGLHERLGVGASDGTLDTGGEA